MPLKRNGPAADGAAARAGDRASGDTQLDNIFAGVRQAATAPRPRIAIVNCQIVRFARKCLYAAVARSGARCVACSAELARTPPAVAVIEAQAAGISLAAGICPCCAARDDRDLMPAIYAALRVLAPSLRPLGPEGSS
jgi:hypothetical protein